ncbi:MAG: GYD domain-containing protein [Chloroflexi bacterium]|nr:GYD domain-containing protein [Chloroflexota bacterium]
MAIYVMLTTLTDEGRKTVKTNPERIEQVNKEVASMGVKVLAQYAVLGPYDFVNILEAPDNMAMSRVAVELGSRGTVQTLTMPAVTTADFVASLKKK